MAEPASQSNTDNLKNFWGWLAARPYLALTLAVVVILGPFLNKPFNIDDPLFLWAAQQIKLHPGNPYGYEINWYGHMDPMWFVTKNPPLACYYLAVASAILGWREFALHTAFLLPAIAVILGTYRLATRFCERPLLAAGVTLFTPVFLVSSNTVMCDTLMLAFWMWATVLWVEGLERENLAKLTAAAVLISLAALTKYFGACLLPLLVAYSILAKRRFGRWLLPLIIPVVVLITYQLVTRSLYGVGLLSDAGGYVAHTKSTYGFYERTWGVLMGLDFTGGCLAIAAFLSVLMWRRTQLAFLAGAAVLACGVICMDWQLMGGYGSLPGSSRLIVEVQIVFWAGGGVSLLALAVADVWEHRDAPSYLLALWVLGTFIFTAFCNWVVNGRSILPMAPAVAMLVVRRLDRKYSDADRPYPLGIKLGLAAGAVLAVLVAQADCATALAVRQSAVAAQDKYGHAGGTLWFRGHWGFQYYLDAMGAKCFDNHTTVFKEGDYLAIAFNNTNNNPPNQRQAGFLGIMATPGSRWVATINKEVGAGFYASVLGPLPFAFGSVAPERVIMYRMGRDPKGGAVIAAPKLIRASLTHPI